MPHGGRLPIETVNTWLIERLARESDLPKGQYMTLAVSDTGSGMSPAVVRRAFDPFFTTKSAGRGAGLGLSMIHGFVQQSGGQTRIESEVRQGTMVCLYLPRQGRVDARETVDGPESTTALALAPRAARGETCWWWMTSPRCES
jgi:signal transduction histidine kinase